MFNTLHKLTFEAWIKVEGAQSEAYFIASQGQNGWGVFLEHSDHCTGKTTGVVAFWAGSCLLTARSNTAIASNTWTHIAVAVDGATNVKFYRNGVADGVYNVAPDTTFITAGAGTNALALGGTFTSGIGQSNPYSTSALQSKQFHGWLDEARRCRLTSA